MMGTRSRALLALWLGGAILAGCAGSDGGAAGTGGAGDGTGGRNGTGGSGDGGASGSGSGGRGAGGAGAGGRGSGGSVGDAGLDAGVDAGADAPADGGGDATAVASCAAGRFAICEDFEATAVGAIPSGWAKQPGNSANVQVASDQAYRGSHALKLLGQASGARTITKTAAQLGALASAHWGRIFYRVQTPAPAPPANGVIHSTLVALSGTSPLPVADSVNVRVVDTVVRDFDGKHQFLYNVQPSTRGEFATEGPYDWTYESKWHCVEWYVSYAAQRYRFFFDSAEVTQMSIANGAGNYDGSEIPAASSIAIGWNNYQSAPGGGFVAWIDEIALDANRIGCDN